MAGGNSELTSPGPPAAHAVHSPPSADSGSITSIPPGTDHARRMMRHTSQPEGMAPSRHSITRSHSTPRRSANFSHDRPASSVNRSRRWPKSYGKSSGSEPSSSLRESIVPPPASGNHYHLIPIIFPRQAAYPRPLSLYDTTSTSGPKDVLASSSQAVSGHRTTI